MKVPGGGGVDRVRLEGLYVRVWGTVGQGSSLDAQEAVLRVIATGAVARVFRDRASGLREDRPGLEKMLSAVADGHVSVVPVMHEDRLARFGAGFEQLDCSNPLCQFLVFVEPRAARTRLLA